MRLFCTLVLALLAPALTQAHVGNHPSVHDTVADIVVRLQESLPPESLQDISVEEVFKVLTEEERHILGEEHITFRVDVPVSLYVFRKASMGEVVFWLDQRGFQKTNLVVKTDDGDFEAWKKDFPAGEIGLGVNSLSGDGDHYFIGMAPKDEGKSISLSEIYPGRHTVGSLKAGERVYVSWDETKLLKVPGVLDGQVLLRGDENKRRSAKLTNIFRMTDYPATAKPDQVVLTWSDDPKTTQAVQWRTNTAVEKAALRYRAKKMPGSEVAADWSTVAVNTKPLVNHNTVNDPVIHRHAVNLVGLKPGTTYEYEVGDGTRIGWTTPAEFTTAPEGDTPFKFIYMGDAQNGLDAWGKLAHQSYAAEPDAAFYIMAGDLVNRGNERFDWDHFFFNAEGIFNRKQLVPCIGNHEDQGDKGPWMYLDLFDLPLNGPEGLTPERAYRFEYSNALFVVLDSNLAPADQAEWLDAQLASSDKLWKFAIYHHPAYSSGANRNNPEVKESWTTLFDKYHVDLALQGHDHAYLRTWPMNAEKKVGSPAEGTIYIVSVSGTKMYDQGDFDYTEFGMTNVATYQVLDLKIDGNKLTYKAYDIEGELRDEFVIEK
jgi:acid phosphatase type 7